MYKQIPALSVSISDDFVLLEKKDQNRVLIFEELVFDWSDDHLREELMKITSEYQHFCNLASEETNPVKWQSLVYCSRRLDLKKIIMENELFRREWR
jgi:hypothetical protein